MFGVIMTTRGSPASRCRPDFDRVYRFPGGEVTGPEGLPEPTAPSGRGRQAAGRPTPGPRILVEVPEVRGGRRRAYSAASSTRT